MASLGGSGSGSFVRLSLPEALTGAGESAPSLTRGCGSWQEASVRHHVGLHSVVHDTAAAFRVNDRRKRATTVKAETPCVT